MLNGLFISIWTLLNRHATSNIVKTVKPCHNQPLYGNRHWAEKALCLFIKVVYMYILIVIYTAIIMSQLSLAVFAEYLSQHEGQPHATFSLISLFFIPVGRLAMVDIAEVNPSIGSQNDVDLTVRNTINVVSHFYGNKRQGVAPPGYEIPRAVIRRNAIINTFQTISPIYFHLTCT